MKNVYVASTNPVKVSCVSNSFSKAFPNAKFSFSGIKADSEVSDQPMSDRETYLGAFNRANNAKREYSNGQYWVGIEGGISIEAGEMDAFAWVVILSRDKIGKSKTATFYLPGVISSLVQQGVELGHADDQVFKRENSKQKDGAIGILTNGLIDRTGYYEQAVTMALIPFMNESLY